MNEFLLGAILGICITLLILLFLKDFILASFFSKMVATVKMVDERGNELDANTKEEVISEKMLKQDYISLLNKHNQLVDDYNDLLQLKFNDTKLADYYIQLYSYLCLLSQCYEVLNVSQLINRPDLKDLYNRIQQALKNMEKDMKECGVKYQHIKEANDKALENIRQSAVELKEQLR